jgi:hypothetical protein
LDGGGVRGIASLCVLKEVMREVAFEKKGILPEGACPRTHCE